jgi:predicted extracellular nuclease
MRFDAQSRRRAGVFFCGIALAATSATTMTMAPALAVPPESAVFVSEIHYDNDGDDTGEAIEVAGPAGTDLSGWTVVLYNGNGGSTYGALDLSGTVDDEGGGFGAVAFDIAGIQNGAPDGLALLRPDDTVVEFLSYEGAFTAVGGLADGRTSTDIGVAESSSTSVGQSLQKIDGTWTGPGTSSFGTLNGTGGGGGDPEPEPATELRIHEVQGSGAASPYDGERVAVEGVVVGAPDPDGPSRTFSGFFVQEEDADADGNAATSEGVFVYTGSDDPAANPALGDTVRVTGTVDEYNGLTEITKADIESMGTGAALPTAAKVTFPLENASDLEAFEGMLATFPDTLTISDYFNYDRYGEVVAAKPTNLQRVDGETQVRPMTPTAVFDPESSEAQQLADLNRLSRITIDDGYSSQNPETPVHPINRELFTQENQFRGGDQVTGLTGPVYYGFGVYRLLPLPDHAGFGDYVQAVPPAQPEDVGGRLKASGANALNYFVTIDDGSQKGASAGNDCGPDRTMECRGADNAVERERQRTKLLNELQGLGADVIGLNEIENTPGVEPLADITAGLNDREGAGTWDYVRAGHNSVVGSDAIKVGLIYRTAAVRPVGDAAVLDSQDFVNPKGEATDKNRAAVAQTFAEVATGEVFSFAVNHLKSKGSACTGEDETLAGNCNETRTLAAKRLAEWIDSEPTGSTDDDWLVLGDLNSYDHEEPIQALEAAGFTDQIRAHQGELAYSYVFDGQFGYLDHLLTSDSLSGQVTGATEWHVNSDTPDIVDYDTSFKGDYQDSLFDPESPYRASDHDPTLIGLDLADSGLDATADPDLLWPPNHKLRAINFDVTQYGEPVNGSATVLDAISSEADSGLGRDDVPNDVVLSDGALQLRAERFSRQGRTYAIDLLAGADGQERFTTTTVVVPADQSNGKRKKG